MHHVFLRLYETEESQTKVNFTYENSHFTYGIETIQMWNTIFVSEIAS